jgi:hypothetical protein
VLLKIKNNLGMIILQLLWQTMVRDSFILLKPTQTRKQIPRKSVKLKNKKKLRLRKKIKETTLKTRSK